MHPVLASLLSMLSPEVGVCGTVAVGVAALAARSVVGRSGAPVVPILLLGAAAGATVVAAEQLGNRYRSPLSQSANLGIVAGATVWVVASGAVALAVALRPGAPVRWTPGQAAPMIAAAALATVPMLLFPEMSPALNLLFAVLPTPVILLAARDSARTRDARRDLGLVQLAAGLVLAGAGVAYAVRRSASGGPQLLHFGLLVALLPTLVLGLAGLARGVGPRRRALAIVGPPVLLTVFVGAAVVEDATRTRRRLWAVDRDALPEGRTTAGTPVRGWVPADACVVLPDGPPCATERRILAWPADRVVPRDVAGGPGEVHLAIRPGDPLGGRVSAVSVSGVVTDLTGGMAVVRDGAGFRVAGVPFPDLAAVGRALVRAREVCKVYSAVLRPDDEWTAGELVPLCLEVGCLLDRREPPALPCRWDGGDWVP